MSFQKTDKPGFYWDPETCKQCDVCQKLCPQGGLKLVGGKLEPDVEKCNLCGICALHCPDRAIKIDKTQN